MAQCAEGRCNSIRFGISGDRRHSDNPTAKHTSTKPETAQWIRSSEELIAMPGFTGKKPKVLRQATHWNLIQ